jgi:hypothetical protein
MKHLVKLALATPLLGLLAGCVESVPAAGPGNSVEANARAACVSSVRSETGNSDVSVLSSEFSEAGTRVVLRVGPTGTWECYGYSDGATDRIMSLTNEGTL